MINIIKKQKGVTLIELIILILIVTIIGVTIAGAVIFFVQLFMYSPRQLDAQKIAQELTNIMIEGSQDARGIRYARNIIDASATQFSYTYGYPTPANQLSVRFRWQSLDKHIYRRTSTNGGTTWSSETLIPYYIPATVSIDGKDTSSVIFVYKKANDAPWVPADGLNNIRRVIIGINVATGSGSFDALEGFFNITASAEIKSY